LHFEERGGEIGLGLKMFEGGLLKELSTARQG